MSELGEGEQLLIWSFRRWVGGTRDWPLVQREFVMRFGGERGRETLGAFVLLIDALRCGARRVIAYHQPCCPCVGRDELALAALVAAAQARQPAQARAHVADLVHEDAAAALLARAEDLAATLRSRGVLLQPSVPAAAPTLH
jgi:hypothetical protein